MQHSLSKGHSSLVEFGISHSSLSILEAFSVDLRWVARDVPLPTDFLFQRALAPAIEVSHIQASPTPPSASSTSTSNELHLRDDIDARPQAAITHGRTRI